LQKTVAKREIAADQSNSTLSDNVSLFQSIRVIQDEDETNVREESLASKFRNLINYF
jgi:hypothetical protein